MDVENISNKVQHVIISKITEELLNAKLTICKKMLHREHCQVSCLYFVKYIILFPFKYFHAHIYLCKQSVFNNKHNTSKLVAIKGHKLNTRSLCLQNCRANNREILLINGVCSVYLLCLQSFRNCTNNPLYAYQAPIYGVNYSQIYIIQRAYRYN